MRLRKAPGQDAFARGASSGKGKPMEDNGEINP